jgi:hypothetical protein
LREDNTQVRLDVFDKLRFNILLLALAPPVTLVLLAIAASLFLAQNERHAREHEAMGRVQSLLSAVEASLQGSLAVANALAASANLERQDVRAFYEECRRVLRSQPNWLNIGLTDRSGVQLFDAVLPFDQPAQLGDPESFARVVQSGKPVFGSLAVGPATRASSVRLRVPVFRNGQVAYVLSIPLRVQACRKSQSLISVFPV